jgi:hypothetical protein
VQVSNPAIAKRLTKDVEGKWSFERGEGGKMAKGKIDGGATGKVIVGINDLEYIIQETENAEGLEPEDALITLEVKDGKILSATVDYEIRPEPFMQTKTINIKKEWRNKMTVKEIVADYVADYLKQNGFDGLCDGDECGCGLEDLMPCGDKMVGDCEPAMRSDCKYCSEKEECEYKSNWDADYCFHKPVKK